jgi:hypothetical protein
MMFDFSIDFRPSSLSSVPLGGTFCSSVTLWKIKKYR